MRRNFQVRSLLTSWSVIWQASVVKRGERWRKPTISNSNMWRVTVTYMYIMQTLIIHHTFLYYHILHMNDVLYSSCSTWNMHCILCPCIWKSYCEYCRCDICYTCLYWLLLYWRKCMFGPRWSSLTKGQEFVNQVNSCPFERRDGSSM